MREKKNVSKFRDARKIYKRKTIIKVSSTKKIQGLFNFCYPPKPVEQSFFTNIDDQLSTSVCNISHIR